ncbi:hypothetical protein [Brenneria roseae]|uniref:tail fiber/spike domain-containing protein n=1 Tax=Brenneria roseae TaxID=1509241 RepID=UPI001FF7C99F|nr:hypothetical protein [Brenneria roseae]
MGNPLRNPNEVLFSEGDGEYYRWDGSLPKIVPPGSTPESTGGVGNGAWKGVVMPAFVQTLVQTRAPR